MAATPPHRGARAAAGGSLTSSASSSRPDTSHMYEAASTTTVSHTALTLSSGRGARQGGAVGLEDVITPPSASIAGGSASSAGRERLEGEAAGQTVPVVDLFPRTRHEAAHAAAGDEAVERRRRDIYSKLQLSDLRK